MFAKDSKYSHVEHSTFIVIIKTISNPHHKVI